MFDDHWYVPYLLPSITAAEYLAPSRRNKQAASTIFSAQASVEVLTLDVLSQDPQVEPTICIVGEAPCSHVRQEMPADPKALALRRT